MRLLIFDTSFPSFSAERQYQLQLDFSVKNGPKLILCSFAAHIWTEYRLPYCGASYLQNTLIQWFSSKQHVPDICYRHHRQCLCNKFTKVFLGCFQLFLDENFGFKSFFSVRTNIRYETAEKKLSYHNLNAIALCIMPLRYLVKNVSM